jgi:catechol 2,3-dioxygenase-like lactoylglutathione lyase family enzyme
MPPILELRVALTVAEYEAMTHFVQAVLGLEPSDLWHTERTRAALYDMGRGTLELFDEPHAAEVDRIETGQRTSGEFRFALRVPDVDGALARARAHGAQVVHEPVVTPWGDRNARIQAPNGLHITLFQAAAGST